MNAAPHSDNRIRTQRRLDCCLCGTPGEDLYQGLEDRLFSAPGKWDLKHCPNLHCGLVWLDPMPLEEDLPLAYRDYFTHHDKPVVRRGIGRGIVHWIYRAFLWATGLAHLRAELYSLYLPGTRHGRLLDVGCGDGGQFARMRAMGWEVEGQEVDAAAAERARTVHGLRVHLGALQQVGLPDAIFDVVTMSHVIEHAHDPVALLKECRRVLKPGGVLMAVTPNINSLGHRRFGSCWLALDPPRHLHLFSPTTLRQVADRAGFRQCSTWTTAANAQFLAEASLNLTRRGRHRMGARPPLGMGLQTLLFQFWAMAIHLVRKDSGEECVLKAVK
jgi:2-polyprenyl-3-methyl-5-hydroxy-6-metoxy-1,4-benzoquinol methylase